MRRHTRFAAALAVFAVAGVGAIALAAGSSFMDQKPPEIECSQWINTPPVNLEQLKGRVVAIEFWSPG